RWWCGARCPSRSRTPAGRASARAARRRRRVRDTRSRLPPSDFCSSRAELLKKSGALTTRYTQPPLAPDAHRSARRARSLRPGGRSGLAADQDGVARSDLRRPGERVMQAAALLALLRAGDDQPRHLGEVAQLEQVAIDEIAPVVLLDLAHQIVEAPLRAREPLVRAHDADVVPHQVAE